MNREIARLEISVPRPWLDRLQTIARQEGRSPEEVTRTAIATYLGISPVELEIADLKLEIGELSKLSGQIASLNLRLSRLEGQTPKPIAPAPIAPGEKDEYEDEPDEILNDFLQG